MNSLNDKINDTVRTYVHTCACVVVLCVRIRIAYECTITVYVNTYWYIQYITL